MENDNRKILIKFLSLCILIMIVFAIGMYRDKEIGNIDRKIKLIVDDYTYDRVFNKGEILFQSTLDLLLNDNAFSYEQMQGEDNLFIVNGIDNYKKITNFNIITNNFDNDGLNAFLDYKKVIRWEDNYYVKNNYINDLKHNNYIGSMLEYDKFEDSQVNFIVTNYFCDNEVGNYIGILDEIPDCDYYTTKSNFKIKYENEFFKVNDIEQIIKIFE